MLSMNFKNRETISMKKFGGNGIKDDLGKMKGMASGL